MEAKAENIRNELVKQIEFYLSEGNLKKDKFFNDILKEKKVRNAFYKDRDLLTSSQ